MSKDIQILKFNVRRDNVRYGPGQDAGNIIYDLPDKEAEKLIAESNGTIVELPRREYIKQKTAAAGKDGKSKNPAEPNNDDNSGGLPGIDPNATVK